MTMTRDEVLTAEEVEGKDKKRKEKLEKEADEYATENYEQCIYDDVIGWKTDYEARKQAYLAGAEPREKRIEEIEKELKDKDSQLNNWYKEWQKQNERIAELEAENDDIYDALNTESLKISELEAQIEKMKCCENCRHREPYCEEAIRLPFGCCCEKWKLREIKEE